MYTTSKLNLMISEIIDEIILNWDTEHSKITVESFHRKNDCLVIIKIRNWSEKHHFLKLAISCYIYFWHRLAASAAAPI